MVVTAVVAAGAVSAGVAGWAPWSHGLPAEGGTGREVASVPALRSARARPSSTAQVTSPTTVAAPAAPQVPASASWIATLHSALPYSATPGGPPTGTLAATNPFGAPNVVALVGAPGAGGWSQVELPVRPDGSTAWLQTAAVTLTWTTYRVAVSLPARTITVTDGPATVLTAPVAVGAPATPTPTGATYLWELIAPDNSHGAYGPYIFGLGMFSQAIAVFNGGDAQIGVHGNDEPWSVGRPVSHGCVRLDNTVITRLAGMLPLGTPVTIS